MKNRIVFAFAMVALLYVPVLLMYFGLLPFEWRFGVLIAITGVAAIYSAVRGHSLYDLGIRCDTVKLGLILNAVWTVVLLGLMFGASNVGFIREPTVPEWTWFFPFYIFVSAPCQEFLYRSFTFAEMERASITAALPQIAISTTTYCFLHVIYNDAVTLVATLFMGVVWGIIYRKTRNFWGVAISHAALGAVSIFVGLI